MSTISFLLFLLLIGCTQESNKYHDVDIENRPIAEKTIEKKLDITGVWGEKNADYATFEITSDSICYLEGGCFKIHTKGKTIKIEYDGFAENFKFELDSMDKILIFKNKESINKFYRFEGD